MRLSIFMFVLRKKVEGYKVIKNSQNSFLSLWLSYIFKLNFTSRGVFCKIYGMPKNCKQQCHSIAMHLILKNAVRECLLIPCIISLAMHNAPATSKSTDCTGSDVRWRLWGSERHVTARAVLRSSVPRCHGLPSTALLFITCQRASCGKPSLCCLITRL